MASGVKPRVKVPKSAAEGETITIKTLISHKMESGQRKDADGAGRRAERPAGERELGGRRGVPAGRGLRAERLAQVGCVPREQDPDDHQQTAGRGHRGGHLQSLLSRHDCAIPMATSAGIHTASATMPPRE